VVGDIRLDVVVRLDGLIQPDTDTYEHAVVDAGGQAANWSRLDQRYPQREQARSVWCRPGRPSGSYQGETWMLD
jgi:hypothetical protein